MSEKIITETIKQVDHPLEEFFDLPEGSTEIIVTEQETKLVQIDDYDDKDKEIEKDFQEVYDKSLSAYEQLQDTIEEIEGKYVARTQEVANQILTTALQAAKEKANMKSNKDKNKLLQNKIVSDANKTTNNNILITDTASLIKQLKEIDKPKVIEAEVVEKK